MNVICGKSKASSPQKMVQEATKSLPLEKPELILFTSPFHYFSEISLELHKKYPDTIILGETSSHSFYNTQIDEASLLITAFMDGISCTGGLILDIDRYPSKYIPQIQDSLTKLNTTENTICLLFTTSFSNSEELVLDTFSSVCEKNNIEIAGGSSGKNEEALDRISYISYNGEVYDKASAFVFIHNKNGKIKIYKENIFIPTEKTVMATSVNLKKRLVNEFNNIPAATYITSQFKCKPEELNQKLQEMPLGIIGKKDYYPLSFEKILPDKSLSLFSRVYNTTNLNIMKSGDYNKITDEVISQIKSEISKPSFVYLIEDENLFSFFENHNFLNELHTKINDNFTTSAGFTALGEQFNHYHLNHTLLYIIFE